MGDNVTRTEVEGIVARAMSRFSKWVQERYISRVPPTAGQVLQWSDDENKYEPATLSGTSSGHTIRENGTDQTGRAALNFVDTDAGAGLVTDDSVNNETEVNLGLYVLEATHAAAHAEGGAADLVGQNVNVSRLKIEDTDGTPVGDIILKNNDGQLLARNAADSAYANAIVGTSLYVGGTTALTGGLLKTSLGGFQFRKGDDSGYGTPIALQFSLQDAATTSTQAIRKNEHDSTSTTGHHDRSHSITSTSDHTSTATSGQMLQADANGLPVNATNTDAQVAAAVTASHAQAHDLEAADHTTSSGVDGHFMRQTGATTFAFEADYFTVNFMINGGGAAIATGIKGWCELPSACVLEEWRILLSAAENITVDVDYDTYANFSTVGNNLVAPSTTGAVKNEATGLSAAVPDKSILEFDVTGAPASAQLCLVALRFRKT